MFLFNNSYPMYTTFNMFYIRMYICMCVCDAILNGCFCSTPIGWTSTRGRSSKHSRTCSVSVTAVTPRRVRRTFGWPWSVCWLGQPAMHCSLVTPPHSSSRSTRRSASTGRKWVWTTSHVPTGNEPRVVWDNRIVLDLLVVRVQAYDPRCFQFLVIYIHITKI